MRRMVAGLRPLAVALLIGSGCHIVGGYDRLTLRDNAALAWALRLRGDGDASVRTIGATPSGEVLVAGTFDGAFELGSTSLPAGSGSAFLALVDASGGFLRAAPLRSTAPLRALRASGRFLAGTFSGALIVGEETVTDAADGTRLFLMDINPMATVTPKAQRFGGAAFELPDDALALAVDTAGNVLVGGGYKGALTFDGCKPYPDRTKSNLFLAKVASDGRCLWTLQNVDDAPQRVESLAVDGLNDYVLVGGTFVGQLRLGETPSLQNSGGTDLFLARLDGDGRTQWSHAFGNGLTQGGVHVAAAPGGYSALVGYFDGTLDFGAGALTATRGHDIVVANFRPNGQLEWQRHLAVNRSACNVTSCAFDDLGAAFDAEGNLVVGGPFRGTLDIEGVTLAADEASTSYFLVKFDRSGNLLWSGQFGTPTDDCTEQGPCDFALALDAGRDVLVGGSFAGTLDFDAVDNGVAARERRRPEDGEPRAGFLAKFLR
jgi:hypothetical protein